jgi:phosphoribosylglycinamide formyltransferase-1
LKTNSQINFAILASGNGSNAQNIIEHTRSIPHLNTAIVITENPDAYIIHRCQKLDVECVVVPYLKEKGKEDHERRIQEILNQYNIHWVLLAGYMRILSPFLINSFYDVNLEQSRIINIHPSLLPQYPGLNSYERAFNDNVDKAGVSVHFVDSGVDTGKIIIQKEFDSSSIESLEEFKKVGFEKEFQAYRQFLDMFDTTGELKHEI